MNNDYPSPNENEQEYVSYGNFKDEMSQNLDQYEYDIDELEDFSTDGLYSDDDETEDDEDHSFSDDLDISSVDEENQYDVLSNINESLNMFKKFKNYN